jgi:hypothetical protein
MNGVLKAMLTVAVLSGAAVGEGGPYVDFSYAPFQWPELERIAAQLPSFAGLTYRSSGEAVVPALSDVSQVRRLRSILQRDSYWRKYSVSPSGAVKAEYRVTELIAAARAIKSVRPEVTVRINTVLNRVTLNLPVVETDALSRRVAFRGLVISEAERPRLHAEVLPSKLSLRAVNSAGSGVVRLDLVLTNTMNRPTYLGYGCGGSIPLYALTMHGDNLPEARTACTGEVRVVVLQPGESKHLLSFSSSDFSGVRPGVYLWDLWITGERTRFTVTP